jgi:hypothetical protein
MSLEREAFRDQSQLSLLCLILQTIPHYHLHQKTNLSSPAFSLLETMAVSEPF